MAQTFCAFGSFAFPVSLGTTAGAGLVNLQEWGHPYVLFVLTSAVVQLFIMLLRSWFRERSENMQLLVEQLDRNERRYNRRHAEEAIERHELANQVQHYAWQNYCVIHGKPMDNPPKPLYDVEKERASLHALETEDIHATSGTHRPIVQRPAE